MVSRARQRPKTHMITVTDEAKAELKRTIESRGLDPGQCLRLAVPPAWTGQGDFGVVIGGQGVADNAIEFEGTTVLLLDADLAAQLSNAVFDFKDARFTLDIY